MPVHILSFTPYIPHIVADYWEIDKSLAPKAVTVPPFDAILGEGG
jgi:hypothetical protein